ncbi:zinc ribbon domain-containing protein [Burkholderia sp. BCC0322]|uniref:zinc ribbon domain-containing protein n=1 Tax=unclassified Burkholderia TaxID=2613784 RepID=UPI00158AE60F|nr:zinc ribbon domain-containing protein [Burkholderia sp. BCC0322]
MSTITIADEPSFQDALEQRADYIPFDDIQGETSPEGESFQNAVLELTNKSLRTLVGPRGAGKTHLMRYTWATCREDVSQPFAIYVSFNRYFRLEPLRTSRPNPTELFHSWALALICLGTYEAASNWKSVVSDIDGLFEKFGLDKATLQSMVSRLERGQPLSTAEANISEKLSVNDVKSLIDNVRVSTGRKYAVLLLDDAALTLTPDYLVDFLDIVRALKSANIAPKASVYPGTTEYSPRFHAGQDALPVPVWHPVDSDNYAQIMGAIAEKRVLNLGNISPDIVELFKYAAFGIPRAFLSMLWDYQRRKFKTAQQGVNAIVQEYLDLRLSEYRSLAKKVPKFATVIRTGEQLLTQMTLAVKDANAAAAVKGEKQVSVGVLKDDITPLVKRMFDLLVEAGLVYEQGEIKHGSPARIYARYVPHTAALLGIRAFSQGQGGTSPKQIVEAIQRRSVKHPIRKRLPLLAPDKVSQLRVDLPECAKCGSPRLAEDQKFCHHCGSQLVSPSTFSECCKIAITEVPGLTEWQKEKISESLPKFKTIGDYLAKQDPSAELLTIYGIGKKRSAKIIDVLDGFVDEFLS